MYDYDKDIFPGGDRSKFLKSWFSFYKDSTVVYKSEGKIQGYGVLRKCTVGYNISPLLADSYEIASELFELLRGSVEADQDIFLQIP